MGTLSENIGPRPGIHNEEKKSTINRKKPYFELQNEVDTLKEYQSDSSEDETVSKTVKKKIADKTVKNAQNSKISYIKESRSVSNGYPIFGIALTVIILMVAAGVLYYVLKKGTEPSPTASHESQIFENIASLIKNRLTNKFKSQNADIWAELRAALRKITKPRNKSPATIAIVSTKGAEETSKCFASILAQSIKDAYEDDGIVEIGDDVDKTSVHDKVHKLKSEKSHAILIENFHKLPSQTVGVFHGFWDDENSPYKDVVYILTVHSNKSEEEIDFKDYSVTSKWEESISADKLSSIESRIRTKILIKTERDIRDFC